MRQKMFYINLLFFLAGIFLMGCSSTDTNAKKYTQVHIINGNSFPKGLVGRWKADRGGWEIEFHDNGEIKRYVHTLGQNDIEAGKKKVIPLIENGVGTIVPGVSVVEFDFESRTLAVEISLDYFKFQRGDSILEGSSRDIFIGSISEDWREWRVLWQTYPNYIISTDLYKEYKLPISEEQHDEGELVFYKEHMEK